MDAKTAILARARDAISRSQQGRPVRAIPRDYIRVGAHPPGSQPVVTDMVEKTDKNGDFLQQVRGIECPVLLLINKIDLTDQAGLTQAVEAWHTLLPAAEIIPISALSGFNVEPVKRRIEALLPDSPPYFEKDALTDRPARFFVTEIIREKILLYYQKEIPYATEVVVEEFIEGAEQIHIRALIIVERDTQKGIIIGHGGQALHTVGRPFSRRGKQNVHFSALFVSQL